MVRRKWLDFRVEIIVETAQIQILHDSIVSFLDLVWKLFTQLPPNRTTPGSFDTAIGSSQLHLAFGPSCWALHSDPAILVL